MPLQQPEMPEIPASNDFLNALARALQHRDGLKKPASDVKLAEFFEVSRSFIAKIRSDQHPDTLTIGMMEKLAGAMGVPYEWVLTCIQVERTQNVAARMAWAKAAKKLAMCLIAGLILYQFPVHEAGAASGDVYIHYAQLLGVVLGWALMRRRYSPMGPARITQGGLHGFDSTLLAAF